MEISPVILWDQFAACKFNLDNLFYVDNTNHRIFMGGLHHNADNYYHLNKDQDMPTFTIRCPYEE